MRRTRGFSLVEMLVALLFTGILMAGMARVFQASLSSFATSAEKISSGRRGRVAIDMLSDDLNAAGMYLWNLDAYPAGLADSNPGFWVNPNVVVTHPEGDVTADEIYFYYDEALPFEATLGLTGSTAVMDAHQKKLEDDNRAVTAELLTFKVTLPDASFAGLVKAGHRLIIKDGWPGKEIESVTASGKVLTIVPKENYADQSGSPMGGEYVGKPHKDGTHVTFLNPAQMVKYGVETRKLSPEDPTRETLCLVRRQGSYNSAAFASTTSQVLAEDVAGLQVFLSVDGGRTWLRDPDAEPGLSSGWKLGLRPMVEKALALGYGRSEFMTLDDPHWYREIPLLLRVDVKTRTAMKRAEHSSTGKELAYKEQVQSLVIKPRHFGLSYK